MDYFILIRGLQEKILLLMIPTFTCDDKKVPRKGIYMAGEIASKDHGSGPQLGEAAR